jgi:hypothetical protein
VSALFATTTPVPQIKATSMPLKQSVELNLMRAGLGQRSVNIVLFAQRLSR